jgi:hypothetical protein
MSTPLDDAQAKLEALAGGDLNIVGALKQMYEGNFAASGLDAQTYELVRLAALTAMDAAPVSWLANLHAAREVGIPAERVLGMLIALAPLVGSARTVAASANMLKAADLAETVVQRADAGQG